jgi:hypothetical protein
MNNDKDKPHAGGVCGQVSDYCLDAGCAPHRCDHVPIAEIHACGKTKLRGR